MDFQEFLKIKMNLREVIRQQKKAINYMIFFFVMSLVFRIIGLTAFLLFSNISLLLGYAFGALSLLRINMSMNLFADTLIEFIRYS